MENSYSVNQPQTDLLDGYAVNLVRAGSGQRLGNMLIDVISFYVLFGVGAAFLAPLKVLILTPLLPALIFALYISLLEAVFGGMTLGKLITGTRAVQAGGARITASQAFARGFSRIVPFEAFSALGQGCYPWHDRWSNTFVINRRESTLPEAEA